MEGTRFDNLARLLATAGSRRKFIGGFLAAGLGIAGRTDTIAAKCRTLGDICRKADDCCSQV